MIINRNRTNFLQFVLAANLQRIHDKCKDFASDCDNCLFFRQLRL